METYYRVSCLDANNELLSIAFFETREEADAAAANADVAMTVIDQGHFEGFSFVKD